MFLRTKQRVFYSNRHKIVSWLRLGSQCCIVFLMLFSSIVYAQSDTTITIKVLGGLQYDLPRFAVKPNTRVTIVLDNHDDMAHNMVITKPNARLKVVDEALKLAEKGAKMNYVPNSPLVIASTKIVEPGQLESFTFLVEKAGIYPYVCTYPGHGFVMYGAMYVGQPSWPPLEKDLNIPEGQRQGTSSQHHHTGHTMGTPSPHPYPLEYPALYRTFMPEASPAAIVVALTATESYCFDAGKCYLRYAWTGGFVDNAEQWKGNGSKLSTIVGDVYWKQTDGFPFRIGTAQKVPVVDFKGYRLKKRLPSFQYSIDQINVTETLHWSESSLQLKRQFVFSPHQHDLYLLLPTQKGIRYKVAVGKITNNVWKIPAKQNAAQLVIQREN